MVDSVTPPGNVSPVRMLPIPTITDETLAALTAFGPLPFGYSVLARDTGQVDMSMGDGTWKTVVQPSTTYGPNPIPSSQLLTGASLPKWRAKLAKALAGTAPARILCIGDSVTRGFGPNPDAFGWPGALAARLTARGLSAARGLVTPQFTIAGGQTQDPRIAYGGGWIFTVLGSLFWGGEGAYWTSNAGAMTFTPGTSCDRFDIYWMANTGLGQISFQVDGGAATPINEGTALPIGIQKTTMAAGAVANNHVLTINWVAGAVVVVGVEAWNSTTPQIVVGNAGVTGSTAALWAAPNPVFGPIDCIKAYAPDLALIMLGSNDIATGRTLVQFLADLQTIIATCQLSGDVIVVSESPTSQAAVMSTFFPYLTTLGVPVVDIFSRWGGTNGVAIGTPLGNYFDGNHPSTSGDYDIAEGLTAALAAVG